MLARLLPTLSAAEARMTAYLLSGRVGPSFSTPEFGIAQALAIRAISEAGTRSTDKVTRLIRTAGDAGKVAELVLARPSAGLSITQVFEAQRTLAHAQGTGSLRRVKPVPGIPVRMMLATRIEDLGLAARRLELSPSRLAPTTEGREAPAWAIPRAATFVRLGSHNRQPIAQARADAAGTSLRRVHDGCLLGSVADGPRWHWASASP